MSEQLGFSGLPDAPDPRPRTVRAVVERKSPAVGRPLRLVPSGSRDAAPDGPREAVRWLHIVAPASSAALAAARSWCRCGYERTARGRYDVLALIAAHARHPDACPLLSREGSKAA
ncbi:hypothetical protein [Streptomyces sp. NPDC001770]